MRYKNNKNLENNKSVRFYFDNKEYFGFEGDTLASALLANDVHLVGRSFKYHRPRGIYTAGSEEPNGIVQLETKEYTEPNRRVTEVQIYEGLKAFSQNNWPSVKFDAGAINDLLSPFFPAGFYYKTFMWPPKFWKAYEFFIRHAAGLGKSPKKDDPHKYEHLHYHCDLLVVGSGVSGLYTAEIAAKKNLNKEKKSTELNLNLNSRIEKAITSKDKKGNAKRFSIKIIINLEVYESEILKGKANFEENFEYNNRSNKFDLRQYEKNIQYNLISKLSDEIIRFLNSLR